MVHHSLSTWLWMNFRGLIEKNNQMIYMSIYALRKTGVKSRVRFSLVSIHFESGVGLRKESISHAPRLVQNGLSAPKTWFLFVFKFSQAAHLRSKRWYLWVMVFTISGMPGFPIICLGHPEPHGSDSLLHRLYLGSSRNLSSPSPKSGSVGGWETVNVA